MREITLQELKDIQLEILDSVHEFCTKNNLKYSISYGTLLGAKRHGGYIPWDDDIDIMMPRKDYEAFIKTYKNPIYQVYHHSITSGYQIPFAKVGNSRTIINEESAMKLQIGINIDIFPIDVCPANKSEISRFLKHKLMINRLYKVFIYKRSDDHLKWKVIRSIINIILCNKPLEVLCRIMDNMSSRYRNERSKYMGIIATSNTEPRSIMDSKIFEDYTTIKFEGKTYMTIKGSDEFLSKTYGDWETLPPIEKQVTHHIFKAYRKD